MALITCPDCKNSVSDQAPACPKCGRPIKVAFTAPAAESRPSIITATKREGLFLQSMNVGCMLILAFFALVFFVAVSG